MIPRDQGPAPDPPVLALRADGGPQRGSGHLGRCLALAQAWVARGGIAVLETTLAPDPWPARYAAAGVELREPGGSPEAEWWVVDGYDLDDRDRPAAAHLGRIDDHGRSPAGPVELVVDQNLDASADAYADTSAPSGGLLLGTRYALVRAELVAAAGAKAAAGPPPSDSPLELLVAMGGAPTTAVAAFTRAALAMVTASARRDRSLAVTVLGGGDDPLPALARADLAFAACGSTSWELCAFAVPAVLIGTADNQEPVGRALEAHGAARYLGPLAGRSPGDVATEILGLAASASRRRELATEARRLVDGRGAARVATRLRGGLVDLRPAGETDAAPIYAWNNETEARAASFRTGSIPWDEHRAWFERRLVDPQTPIFMARDHHGVDLGVVRFTIGGPDEGAEIGIALAPERRGQGWGPAVIDAACRHLFATRAVDRVIAQVKVSNPTSSRAFLDADFDPVPPEDSDVLRYDRRRARTPPER